MGHPHYDRSTTDLEHGQLSESEWAPPYLPRALLHAPTRTEDCYLTNLERSGRKISLRVDADFDKDLTDLLTHIEQRLHNGVLEAWMSVDGYCDFSEETEALKKIQTDGSLTPEDRERKSTEATADFQDYFFSPEECWARAFAEMVSFLPYSGVGESYYEHDQKTMFEKFPDAYPALVACQDLCTLCVLSRGFTYADISLGLLGGISCTDGCITYPAFDKHVFTNSGIGRDITKPLPPPPKNPKDPPAPIPVLNYMQTSNLVKVTDKNDNPIPPGSILVFNGGPEHYKKQDIGMAHVISVLRVSGQRVQFLETGMTDAFHTFDTAVPFAPLVGVGALGAPRGDLKELATKMALSRPLAYARLLVLDTTTTPATLRFASKVFHMRYHLSRYVWALRGLPTENLRVVVHMFVPNGKASTNPLLKDDTLSSSPADLIPKNAAIVAMAGVRGEPGDGVEVARRRQSSTQDTWYKDLAIVPPGETGKPPGDEMAFQTDAHLTWWPGDATKLGAQIKLTLDTLNQRYVRKTLDPTGTFDEGNTGVAHFDP